MSAISNAFHEKLFLIFIKKGKAFPFCGMPIKNFSCVEFGCSKIQVNL